MLIKEIIKNRIKAVLEEMGIENTEIELESPPDDKMGDLAFPCFNLSKVLKKSPSEIAEELAKKVEKGDTGERRKMVEKVETQGGYVNFFYDRNGFLNNVLNEVLKKGEEYGRIDTGSGKDNATSPSPFLRQAQDRLLPRRGKKRIMVEYSSPNTNKPLHLGHGRNNFLGMAVSNLLENAGASVIRGMIINDRGIHICKSMVAYQEYGKGETPEKLKMKGDHFVGKYYGMFGDKLKEGPSLEEKAKNMLRKWEAGDQKVMALWEKMNSWYYEGVSATYEKIGSKFDDEAVYYESKTYKQGKEIIMDALNRKIVYKKEDGAIAIDLSEDGLDEKILLRSDGTSVYITQDLYTAIKRFTDFDLDELIYVVGNEQNYHFEVLFKILEKLGYPFAKDNSHLRHLSYGMVTVPGGKLKSREGTKVDLDDLVAELKEMALKAIYEKHGNTHPLAPSQEGEKIPLNPPFSKGEIEERAMRIGLAALKFMILRVGPEKNVFFNPAEAISFEGDTGPYILYAYTRIKSILRKAGGEDSVIPFGYRSGQALNEPKRVKDPVAYTSHAGILRPSGARTQNDALGDILVSDEEMKLVKMIYDFPYILEKAARENDPSRVANFILELAGAFNSFYHIHKVIDAETAELKEMRLDLIKVVAIVLERGMNLLGIDMVEEM